MNSGFPWLWLYYRAIDCGLDDAAFWRHSARAIHLLYKQTRQARARMFPQGRQPGRQTPTQPQRGPVERVRLTRLPHP